MTNILMSIPDAIMQALNALGFYLSILIYKFIIDVYSLFETIARADILQSGIASEISRKVGLILGMFMVFKLIFSLIQSLIDPDKLKDKEKGAVAIIRRSIIAIVLLGITPSLFKEAYQLQRIIIGAYDSSDNIIYKLIVGGDINKGAFGETLASEMFFSFITVEDDSETLNLNNVSGLDINIATTDTIEEQLVKLKNLAIKKRSFGFMKNVVFQENNQSEYILACNGLLSVAFGIFTLWMLITYCVQISIRVFQLAYLQIVSPIPILSYISDSKGTFQKWVNQCTTTYLDLFLRLAIIYFVVFLSQNIIDMFKEGGESLRNAFMLGPDDSISVWVKLFLIIGLLMFAKKVPELLKDLFPSKGGAASLGFGMKGLKSTIGDIPVLGKPANKVLGYAGNVGKKAGKFAWGVTGAAAGKAIWEHTGGKIPKAYNRWQEDRKSAKEINEMEKPGRRLYEKYDATGIENAFKNQEFRNSYKALKAAKDENNEAENAYEIAKASGNSQDLAKAIERRNTAAKALSDAQKTHDNMRKRYGADARKEDQIGIYKSMHPTATSSRPNSSNSNNSLRNAEPQNTGTWSQGPYVSPQQAEDNAYNEMINAISNDGSEEEINSKIDAYNKASQKRQQVDNDIDDFYDRQNDGFGGQ